MASNLEAFLELQAALPYEDWAAIADEGAQDDLRAVLERIAGDGLVTVMAGDATFRQQHRGIDGFIAGWRDWLAPFETYATEPEEIIEHDDHFVLLVRQRATPKGGGPAMDNPGAAVFGFDAERLVRIEFHLDRSAALRSAGISEADG